VTSSGPDGEDAGRPQEGTGAESTDAEQTATPTNAAPDDPAGDDPAGDDGGRARARGGSRLSVPLVPTLLVVLLLLLGATAFLWVTRPEASAVRTGDYVEALQAARSGVVDFTSFDYLTLDDDIEQMRRIATGDLREEGVAQLDGSRDQITAAEAVVNTEVVGAGVTRANDSGATVLLVIQSTQESKDAQAQVVRYRIEVELEKTDGRWLLSGIKGTGTEDE
jgi:hypothetical protein